LIAPDWRRLRVSGAGNPQLPLVHGELINSILD
jgi:hypothetical protein